MFRQSGRRAGASEAAAAPAPQFGIAVKGHVHRINVGQIFALIVAVHQGKDTTNFFGIKKNQNKNL